VAIICHISAGDNQHQGSWHVVPKIIQVLMGDVALRSGMPCMVHDSHSKDFSCAFRLPLNYRSPTQFKLYKICFR
jgi:hypothetical protein